MRAVVVPLAEESLDTIGWNTRCPQRTAVRGSGAHGRKYDDSRPHGICDPEHRTHEFWPQWGTRGIGLFFPNRERHLIVPDCLLECVRYVAEGIVWLHTTVDVGCGELRQRVE